jgi:twinkle protein
MARQQQREIETQEVSSGVAKYLGERGITENTLKRFLVREGVNYISSLDKKVTCIFFPYFNNGKIYAQKIRAVPEKGFACNGSPQTFFGADQVSDWSEIAIVEGEIDALSCSEANIRNVVSIPNGAKDKISEDGVAFRFLANHEKDLAASKKIIIALDRDRAGEVTSEEFARRLGRDRCWLVEYPEGCKDANDVLVQHGSEALAEAFENAKPWPISGLYDAAHFADQVAQLYEQGLGRGETVGLANLDHIYSVVPGQLTVVTGHPGSGKSELVDHIMMHLAEKCGWRHGIASFENMPQLHIAKLIQKYIGKPFFSGVYERMDEDERNHGMKFVTDHFSFIHSTDGNLTTLDSIIERLKIAVMRHGIKGAVIDPYNYISKPRDVSETDWISEMLSRVRSFAQAHGIHVWFVAHPTKQQRTQDGNLIVPKGNEISGSAAWWAKADMGLTVHRSDPGYSNVTEVHVWKVRFSWTGRQGKASVFFNEEMSRYYDSATPLNGPKIVVPF